MGKHNSTHNKHENQFAQHKFNQRSDAHKYIPSKRTNSFNQYR